MSTQVTATQSNFANQATNINSPQTVESANAVEEEKLKAVEVSAVEKESKQQRIETESEEAITNEIQVSEEDKELVEEALELISEFMQLSSRNVNFQQDIDSEKTVIKFFDSESRELIKQFPSEEVIEIAQKIIALQQDVGEKTGILLEEKV